VTTTSETDWISSFSPVSGFHANATRTDSTDAPARAIGERRHSVTAAVVRWRLRRRRSFRALLTWVATIRGPVPSASRSAISNEARSIEGTPISIAGQRRISPAAPR
jgi:hypothetical protein